MKIKPKSEISSHITLPSVISGLFLARYLHHRSIVCKRGPVILGTPPADILAAALTWVVGSGMQATPLEGSSCKNPKNWQARQLLQLLG